MLINSCSVIVSPLLAKVKDSSQYEIEPNSLDSLKCNSKTVQLHSLTEMILYQYISSP